MKKVEIATLQQLDHELGTSIHMDTYESLAGLMYESDDAEDDNVYDSEGNVIHFASVELEEIIQVGLEEYKNGLTTPWHKSN